MICFTEKLETRTMMSAVVLISSAQQANLQKLATDLQSIHAKSSVTTAEISTLVSAVKAVVAVAVKPDPTLVTKFKTDLKTDLADGALTTKEKAQLYTDWSNVLVSADVPPSLAQAVAADTKAIVISSNVTAADVQLIDSDLLAIVNTFKASH